MMASFGSKKFIWAQGYWKLPIKKNTLLKIVTQRIMCIISVISFLKNGDGGGW